MNSGRPRTRTQRNRLRHLPGRARRESSSSSLSCSASPWAASTPGRPRRPSETPARKITRLRAKAARVRAEQAETRERVLDARHGLRAARRLLGRRLWTTNTGGAPSTLGQLLGADSVHQALVTTKDQEQVGADPQERLKARLVARRSQIEYRLAAQRRFHKRLTRQVRRAVAAELRRLAAERAARVSRAQWHAGPRVGLGNLAAGDLVFFAYDTGNPGSIHHVGRYVDGGAMIEAPSSGARVRVASIGRRDHIGAVRPTG